MNILGTGAPRPETGQRYVVYLIAVALAGLALTSYDINLLVLLLPAIAKSLHLGEDRVALLGFFVYAAEFVFALFAGWAMDRFGRRRVWMVCLSFAAIFTGLTFLVQNFWQLALVRALASGLAFSELVVSITIVNEQLPARTRGMLYSIVQGGWPIGVFLAAGVVLAFGRFGWRFVFLLGVLPILVVMIGRVFIRESERFEHVQQLKQARRAGGAGVPALLRRHAVDVGELDRVTIGQLFARPGYVRRQVLSCAVTWFFYASSGVGTNFYITYWLTAHKGFTETGASTLLLVSGGIGFFFYLLGGWLGERWGRARVITLTGVLIAPLNLIFLYVQSPALICVVYFLIYQATNGTWSGAGYAYQGESFPTRVRGTAVGFLGAAQVSGFVVGSLLWTLLISSTTPTVTWWIVSVLLALGLWSTLLLARIPPGQELEMIAT